MQKLIKPGRAFFAISMAAFGLLYLIHALFAAGPGVGPPWTPAPRFWGYLTAIVSLAAAASIAGKIQRRCAAIMLAVTILVRALLVYGPKLAANLRDPGPWTSGFELLAMCGAALVLAGTFAKKRSESPGWKGAPDTVTKIGRFLFAVALVVFGIQHFLYGRFVATLVPAWIPGHLFWAYFVGFAFVAAAASIATQIKSDLAAALLGLMFLLWVLVLHLPRVAAAVHNGNEWTSAFVALAMCGGAFVLAATSR